VRAVVAVICMLIPSLSFAAEINKTVTWRKPEIYINYREACHSLGSKYGSLVSADLVKDTGPAVTVKCTFVR